MGVVRLMGTILRHPATSDALFESVPIVECLLIDHNANIHYVLQKTITELNEILYYTYYSNIVFKGKNDLVTSIEMPSLVEMDAFNKNLELNIDDIKEKLEKYHDEYEIGTTYEEIKSKLTSNLITKIIYTEVMIYTQLLICSLNRGYLKKVFISLDGTPSMAKIKEQKNRRYIGAYLNNIKTSIVKRFKFDNNEIYQIDLFHFRTAICVGTEFMDQIQNALFQLDFPGIEVIVSPQYVAGEGEKKIIHALDDFDYDQYCIMSPDSDMLILIGILSNNVKFNTKQLYNFRIDYQNKNQYQFFDLRKLLTNLMNYFGTKINHQLTYDKMIDLFFMLLVFGNDFIPKLEPLNITRDFDFVCESCLKLLVSGIDLRVENKLNYNFIKIFFKLLSKKTIDMGIECSINDTYNNYYKLCRSFTITEEYLKIAGYYHPQVVPIEVNYKNFANYTRDINRAYGKLINFLKRNFVRDVDITSLYRDIHRLINDSYMLLTLPQLLKFPGSNSKALPFEFFKQFVEYTNQISDFRSIKFKSKLMTTTYQSQFRPLNSSSLSSSSSTAYLAEMEKFNRSMEPYRSVMKMSNINLVKFDIETNQLIDLRHSYYQTYVKNEMTNDEIDTMILNYLVGIEWLYQYYILGEHLEQSLWCYNYTQPPLIDSIVYYLEHTKDIPMVITAKLESYPTKSMEAIEHYLFVTPNEYTNANISPNLADVIHLIDGSGAIYLNRCQIKWHEL